MLKKVNDILAGIPMTIVGGIALLLSLALDYFDAAWVIDPAWLAVFICGLPLLYLAVWRIIYNPGISKISSALLITMAMFAALAVGDYFAAGEVAFIMSVGAILEEKTTERARRGLDKLIGLSPQKGRRVKDGREEMLLVEQIASGDLLRVLPGEKIPVDGVIVAGTTSVDQSVMTGESLPVDKACGDEVYCGTVNRFGSVDIVATKVGEDSSLQKLIRLVKEAEEKKAPMARIADRWASYLVPIALLIAIASYIFTGDFVSGVTVLVVFCPCALVLATPTAIMAAIGQATKYGVIIKSGEALEKMGKVDTIAIDKTGTLTYGRMEVSDILPATPGGSPRELLTLAAAVEARSEHPLGKAVVARVLKDNLPVPECVGFKMTVGQGVAAKVAGKAVFCGKEGFLAANGIHVATPALDRAAELRRQGKAAILVGTEGGCAGIIALSDVLRPEAAQAAAKLKEMGTEIVLVTGDNASAAVYFASLAGIKQVEAELLPQGKTKFIEELEQAGHRVAMLGDGVNDAPALKTASVGIAMGGMGTDIAVEAADIALMGDDLAKIPYLKRLANATVKTIKLSISLSLCLNAIAIILSVKGILNPTTGALWHNAGSCFVVLIAALLYDRKFI